MNRRQVYSDCCSILVVCLFIVLEFKLSLSLGFIFTSIAQILASTTSLFVDILSFLEFFIL